MLAAIISYLSPNALTGNNIYTTKVHNEIFRDEKELVKKCIAWDRDAQNFLYRQFAGKMFIVCQRYSTSREEAEDTLQEGFMKVFENIKKYRNDGPLEGWIRKIIYHTAIEKYRKTKTKDELTIRIDDITSNEFRESATIESKLNSKELIELIQKLTPGYRMVFNLYVFEGLTHKEIAKELNISEGTSKSNLSDARKILQKALESHS